MAIKTQKDQVRYIEFGGIVIDYDEGDVIVLDNVKDISPLFPLKPASALISVCCQGWQKLLVNGVSIDFSEGCLLVCPPSAKVSVEAHSDDFSCKILCLSDHLIRGLLRDKIDTWNYVVYVNQTCVVKMPEASKEEFCYYYALIRSKMRRDVKNIPYEILLALLRALLLEFSFMLDSTHEVSHETRLTQGKVLFNRFLSLISNNELKRQPVAYYAGQLAITPKYLTMLCQKYSDKTASEWVAQYTVEDIRYFLKNTDLSIKEISARMGFSNMSQFGSYVRKYFGVSPSEFRYSKKI